MSKIIKSIKESDPAIYSKLNSAWKQTIKVVLGKDVGDIEPYEEYLQDMMFQGYTNIDKNTRKIMRTTEPYYCKGSKFIPLSSVDFNKTFEPLDINEVKDIDSIAEALRERFTYVANIVEGNSKFVDMGSNITDSFYVFNAVDVAKSQYIAYTSRARYAKYFFGVDWGGEGEMVVRSADFHKNHRVFEAHACYGSSDTYYSFAVGESYEIMFSFGGRGRRYTIGNKELAPEKYLKIKSALLEQIRVELEKNKKLPSLFELVPNTEIKLNKTLAEAVRSLPHEERGNDLDIINKDFHQTAKTILGGELEGHMDDYGDWLLENVTFYNKSKSAVSDHTTLVGTATPYVRIPNKRMVTLKELEFLADRLTMSDEDIKNISFDKISNILENMYLFTSDMVIGKIVNVIESTVLSGDTMHGYKLCGTSSTKYSAFSFWPRNSEHTYGVNTLFHSMGVMKSYFSTNIRRGFEVDGSHNSSDIYFAHTCESCNDVMFEFRRKNARYEIGNAKYPIDKYTSIKKAVLEQIRDKLNKNKKLEMNIFNIGCGK